MWQEYEQRKRQLPNLPPDEYEKEIQKILKELENDITK